MRTTDRFMLVTPEPALIVVALYLTFVVVGPRLMAHRAPFDLRAFIVAYNFVLVLLSSYMSYEVSPCRASDVIQASFLFHAMRKGSYLI